MGKCTFLSGWAIPAPHTIQERCNCIDSTFLVGSNESPLDILRHDVHESDTIIGFSLGAILALQIAQIQVFKKVILFAPTFSFCKSTEYPLGISPKLINSMMKNILLSKENTLQQFYQNCGISEKILSSYSDYQLIKSLSYLRDVIIPQKKLAGNPHITVIHGQRDRIISIDAGRGVALFYNAQLIETAGSHIDPLLELLHNYL